MFIPALNKGKGKIINVKAEIETVSLIAEDQQAYIVGVQGLQKEHPPRVIVEVCQ